MNLFLFSKDKLNKSALSSCLKQSPYCGLDQEFKLAEPKGDIKSRSFKSQFFNFLQIFPLKHDNIFLLALSISLLC